MPVADRDQDVLLDPHRQTSFMRSQLEQTPGVARGQFFAVGLRDVELPEPLDALDVRCEWPVDGEHDVVEPQFPDAAFERGIGEESAGRDVEV